MIAHCDGGEAQLPGVDKVGLHHGGVGEVGGPKGGGVYEKADRGKEDTDELDDEDSLAVGQHCRVFGCTPPQQLINQIKTGFMCSMETLISFL